MNFKMKGNGSINIDGRSFSGRSVVIKNGKVTVDGVLQDGDLTGPVSITVQGDVETIDGEFADVTALSKP